MEVPDSVFSRNLDWDPTYLSEVLSSDFYDFTDLWDNSMDDNKFVEEVEKIEMYSPLVEDVSLDDDILCSAVEKLELE